MSFGIEFCQQKDGTPDKKVFVKVPHHEITVYHEGSSVQVNRQCLIFYKFRGLYFVIKLEFII